MKRITGADCTDEVSELELRNGEISYEAAVESFVLLKNDGCLPLKTKEVALFGNGASHTIKGGSGSGEANNRHSISIYEGLKECGLKIASESYLEEYIDTERKVHDKWIKDNTGIPDANAISLNYRIPDARAILEDDLKVSDKEVAIYVIARQSGEGTDKKIEDYDFNLKGNEIRDLDFLYHHFKHLILIINSGASLDLSEIDDMNISIVFYGQAGGQGGKALADVLTGKAYFSGKLSSTWVKSYEDIPFGREFSYLNKDLKNEYYKEGIYVGYRYFDSFDVKPRFRFGYGLSYSSFKLETIKADINERMIELTVSVENTGNYKGKETVEVYASLPVGKLDKEYQRLVAFKKSKELNPKEKQTLNINFDIRYLASYSKKEAATLLEKGDYIIKIGNSSDQNKPVLVMEVKDDLILMKHQNITGEDVDELFNTKVADYDLKDVKRVVLDASKIKTEVFNYEKREIYSDEKVDAIINKLSEEELVDVCVGIGTRSIMNTSCFCTPGVAGKTTDKLLDKGLLSVNLADGPTGLRILRKGALSPSGRIRMFKGDYIITLMEIMPSWLLFFYKPRKKDKVFYQYATAFPVGSNLAQTWNEELLEKVGKAISEEMDKFNVTYLLAPGMNIHRNPLCGRNFEYYSEDPVLSGKISAAMSKGVQSIKGNYTTIKHFACNNTEDNREHSNSHVSERALREIYLRGFEINIKEAGSKSLMTSYNLINGTYAPDSDDLCNKVLRNEWGFDGVVMSDWYSTRKGQGHSAIAIASGNDLIMPGGKAFKKEILKALKDKSLSLDDLKRAAANIIRSIVYSNVASKYSPDDFK